MSGYVYFITPEAMFCRTEESLKLVKIGFTRKNPIGRMRDLQCGSPVRLDLHAYIDGSDKLERAFHDAFSELRSCGEWFTVEGKLFDFLGYFDDLPPRNRYVDRERLLTAVGDVIFATGSSYPEMSDEFYLSTCKPQALSRWFPEVAM